MSLLSPPRIIAVALISFLPTTTAQTSPVPFTTTNTITWPSALGTPTFKRVITGDYNGDTVQDAVVLSGTDAVYIHAPQDWNKTVTLSGAFNDISTAPRTSPAGFDSIASVSSSGLQLTSYSTTTYAFSTSLISNSTPWLNAKIVRAADINGGAVCDYVGVASDLRTVIVRVDVGGVPTQTTFTSAYDILDVVLLAWDNDAPLEIACLDSHGVDVYKQNGTLTAWFANNGAAGDSIAAYRVTSDTHDHLAWVQKTAAGSSTQTLNELSRQNGKVTIASPSTLPALLTNNSYVFVAAADSPGIYSVPDGNSELVIAHSDGYAMLVLQNLGSTPPGSNFTVGSGSQSQYWGYTDIAAGLGVYSGASTMPFAYSDLDGDGTPDLLVPVRVGASGNVVRFVRGQSSAPVSVNSGAIYQAANLPSWTGSPPNVRPLTLTLTFPYNSGAGSYVPPGANALEVVMWKEVDGVLQVDSFGHPVACGHWYYPTPAPDPSSLHPVVPIPETGNCFGTSSPKVVYWIESRYATVDFATPKIVKSWESYVGYLTTNLETANAYVTTESMIRCMNATPVCDGPLNCDSLGGTNQIIRSPVFVTRRTIAPSGNGVWNPGPPSQGSWGN